MKKQRKKSKAPPPPYPPQIDTPFRIGCGFEPLPWYGNVFTALMVVSALVIVVGFDKLYDFGKVFVSMLIYGIT